ncbi:thermonuclease family protein [Limoniibacter endophyticus]|uniref:Nuclease n=1 Tax=Limoniibacter endophyticus TaxID=1565040 RepID=A0A8J3DR60_9HYPH|nr:thermonuclease family protein [Limoniibacter endophyticus]GHC75798.1 nuclease [Limoniibacter endophyticus]
MTRFLNNKRRRRFYPRRKSHARKMVEMGVTLVILLGVAVLAGRFDTPDSRISSGKAVVNDGDTITLGAERVRLLGIDAPEFDQTCRDGQGSEFSCGRRAKQELVRLIDNRPVRCEGWERDKYDRLLGSCFAGTDDVSLNAKLVATGWAVTYGGFDAEQRQAREEARGMWAGNFERPRDFRIRKGAMLDDQHGGLTSFWNWIRTAFGLG